MYSNCINYIYLYMCVCVALTVTGKELGKRVYYNKRRADFGYVLRGFNGDSP